MMEGASTIYRTQTAVQAQHRIQEWAGQWQERAPDAVATLKRDFEATLVFYQLDTLTASGYKPPPCLSVPIALFALSFVRR